MKNLTKLLAATALAGAAAMTIGAVPASAQMREHFTANNRGFHETFRGGTGFHSGTGFRGTWHPGFWRGRTWHPGWRGSVAIGFYGYPYAYGYPYYGYYNTCDPYNPYYDPYACSY